MALSLNFSTCVSTGCEKIIFNETTGVYNTSNPGGYEGINPSASAEWLAILTVTNPLGVISTFDITGDGFVSSNPGLIYNIPLEYMDGKWTFTYTTTTDGITFFTKTKYSYFYCTTECCVTSKLANITTIGCDSCKDSVAEKEYIKMFIMLESLKNAARCGSESTFNSIKKIIDKLCKNNACNTCK